MKKKEKLIFYIVYVAATYSLLMSGSGVNAKEKQDLLINQEYSQVLQENEVQQYTLQINGKLDKFYLIVTAEGTFEGSEPDIYIDTRDFQAGDNAEYVCKSFGFALCYLHGDSVKQASTFYISVKCTQKCGYELKATLQEESSVTQIGLNDIKYAIFEDSKRNMTDKRRIFSKVMQMKFDEDVDLKGEELQHLMMEFELINPIQSYTTFNVYINFNDQIPTKGSCQSWGLDWGSGAGMGVLVQSRKVTNIPKVGTYTLSIEAHEGAIIAVRSFGWGEVRKIDIFDLVGGFTFSADNEVKFEIDTRHDNPDFNDKDLVIGLVPFQGDPDLYIHDSPFSSVQSLDDYKWKSDQDLDDRITISAEALENIPSKKLYLTVTSKYGWSLFSLRAYYPLGKTPINFDFPESGTLPPSKMNSYSLSVYGNQPTDVTLTLSSSGSIPTLIFKRCDLNDKSNCLIDETNSEESITSEFLGDKIAYRFTTDPKKCSENIDGLPLCYYLIGILNRDSDVDIRYTLLASNGVTHTILQEDQIYYEGMEFGKVNYYMLNLTSPSSSRDIDQISFQLSNVQGKVSMFASFENNPRPDINSRMKVSFFHTLHLYRDEFSDLNRVIYLGIQADSSFATYSLQVKVSSNSQKSYYNLEENQPLIIQEDPSKVSEIHFKFPVTKSLSEDIQFKIILEPISGNYDMSIGFSPDDLAQLQSSQNMIVFSTSMMKFTHDREIVYGFVKLRESSTQANQIYFKMQYQSQHIIHQNLNLGAINQLRLTPGLPQYFKVPIRQQESVYIFKKVQDSSQNAVQVIVSYDQNNIMPKELDANILILKSFVQNTIYEQTFQEYCEDIDEFNLIDTCHLYIAVYSTEDALLLLYVDINSEDQFIFSDMPNVISFRGSSSKKLFQPQINSKNFNIFKTATYYNSQIMMCAKLFNNTLPKQEWPYPTDCKYGSYDFKFSTQGDENYLFNLDDENNEVCDFEKKECGLVAFMKDISKTSSGKKETDYFMLTLQQTNTRLHAGESITDSLPQNGVRFYYLEFPSDNVQEFAISVTEFKDESIELTLYQGTRKLYTTKKDELPHIRVDTKFMEKHQVELSEGDLSVEVKSRDQENEVSYSILYKIKQEGKSTPPLTSITNGQSLQVQLDSMVDNEYFIFQNTLKQPFKVMLSQQNQGNAKITVDIFDEKTTTFPLKKGSSTYDDTLIVQEKEGKCPEYCTYVIQVSTEEDHRIFAAFSIQSLGNEKKQIQLLENIESKNNLTTGESVEYIFNCLQKAKFRLDLKTGVIQVIIKTTDDDTSIYQKVLSLHKQSEIDLEALDSINSKYVVLIKARENSSYVASFVEKDTIPQIVFDQPLKNQIILRKSNATYTFQTSGDRDINVQLIVGVGHRDGIPLSYNLDMDESFVSDEKVLQFTTINQYYDFASKKIIINLKLFTDSSISKVFLTLYNNENFGLSPVTISVSANYQILTSNVPMYFVFTEKDMRPKLFEIIPPDNNNLIYIQINYLNGEVRAACTTDYQSAIENNQFSSYLQANTDSNTLSLAETTDKSIFVQMSSKVTFTQGYIKFQAFPPNTDLPLQPFTLPTDSHIKAQLNQDSRHLFTFNRLIPKPDISENADFTLQSVFYSLFFTEHPLIGKNSELYVSTPKNSETQMVLYNEVIFQNEKTNNYPMLFQSFEDNSRCNLDSSLSGCQQEIEIKVPQSALDNFIHEQNSTVVFVKARANFKGKSNQEIFTRIYSYGFIQFEELKGNVQVQEGSFGISPLMIVIIGLTIISLLIGVIVFFKKYKHTEKRLSYEMSDVRNVANMGASIDQVIPKNPQKHIPLDEEDERI